MSFTKYIVHNFSHDASIFYKLKANVYSILGRVKVPKFIKKMDKQDLAYAKKCLRKGDIVLAGRLDTLSHICIGGLLTHSLLYIGNKKFIHSKFSGVEEKSINLLNEYDTVLVLRHKDMNSKKAKKIIDFAKKQINKPYDYDFEPDQDEFYCTELIYYAFLKANIDLKPKTEGEHESLLSKLQSKEIIHPLDYIRPDMDIVFKSHNITYKNGCVCKLKTHKHEKIELKKHFV